MARESPGNHVTVHRAIAEGDVVGLPRHHVWPGDEAYAGIDIVQFDADDKGVEHGDALRVVPATSANDAGLF